MKITCHSCAAKYTVSDEKVQGKTVKMKCRKCGATIVVGGAASGDGAVGADDAVDGGEGVDLPPGSYLLNINDGDQRTMTMQEVVDAYNQGVVTADTYVWTEGMGDWQALGENDAIVAALNDAASGAAPAGNGTNGGGDYQQPNAYEQAAPSYEQAAPSYEQAAPSYEQAAPSYGQAAPSYGQAAPQPASSFEGVGGFQAGSDMFGAAPAAEAARPAARRDAGRKSQDLFGSGYGVPSGGGGAFPAAEPSGGGTGKRDENSVLFSLSALTGGAPAKSNTAAAKEDSGLIDLKALALSAAPAAAPMAAPMAAPAVNAVGLFPLGAPVAPAAAQYPQSFHPAAAPAEKKMGPLPLILGGIGFLGLAAAVFMFIRSTGEPKPTATAAPPPTVTVIVTAEPAPVPAPASAEVAEADPSASAEASGKPVAAGGRPTGGRPPPGGTTKPPAGGSTGAAPPTTAKPPTSKCNCPPGDLMCAMKCSTK